MRILLDHNVPLPLRRYLSKHEVLTANYLGWYDKKNGVLLKLAEESKFDLLVTCDTSMRYQQRIVGRKIGILAITQTHWTSIKQEIEQICLTIDKIVPGSYQEFVISPHRTKERDSGLSL
jgi:predicted nuclease of predicted toxin-antitoxin system